MNPVRYFYSLIAFAMVASFAGALGFVLVSSIRHFVWSAQMESHISIFVWVQAIVVVCVMLLFWYRLIIVVIRHRWQQRRFHQTMEPHLAILDRAIPSSIKHNAQWSKLDDSALVAFTWGVIHPRVAISKGLCDVLDDPSLHAVMYHEAAHVSAHDALQQSFLHILSDAFGTFGLRPLYDRYLIQREIFADKEALLACNGDDIPLLSALLSVARGNSQNEIQSVVGLIGALNARLTFLETGAVPAKWDKDIGPRVLSGMVAIVLTVAEGLLIWCH